MVMLRSAIRKFATPIWFIVSLLLLLLLLAGLQYRWLGQVSEGDRARLQAALQAGGQRFSEDFDREISRAFYTFQLSAESLRGKDDGELARRYRYWVTQTPHPQLVKEVFLLTIEKEGTQLQRFNAANGRVEPAPWPDEVETFRLALERQDAATLFSAPALRDFLIEDGPALILPIVPETPASDVQERALPLKLSGYAIVLLSRDYICQKLLPALARRYFAAETNSREMEYQLAVISRRAPQIPIYSSTSAPTDALPENDMTAELFRLRFDLIREATFTQALPLLSLPPEATGTSQAVSTVPATKSPGGGASLFPNTSDELWQLRIRHRAGSLDLAVARLRRNNLLISFGALLLLAGSALLLYVTTQRERRLARQQIEFVAGVSHELRLPVSVVCMASANLADGMIRDPQQVKQYGNLIRNAGRRLTEMIEQVLDFAGTELIRKPYHLSPVNVAGVIENLLITCRSDFEAQGFKVETQLAAEMWVNADSAALRRAMQNLLNNAMKYSDQQRLILIRAHQQNNEAQITVEDHGMGIDAAELPHLFEPFRRGQAAVAAQIPGNGLGLSLVRRVLEAHGGSVTVRSRLGQGSAFTLHLPIAPQPQEGDA